MVWPGMNLQICFMNETASDNESQASDVERNYNYNNKNSRSNIFTKSNFNHPYQTRPLSVSVTKHDKVSTAPSGKYIVLCHTDCVKSIIVIQRLEIISASFTSLCWLDLDA